MLHLKVLMFHLKVLFYFQISLARECCRAKQCEMRVIALFHLPCCLPVDLSNRNWRQTRIVHFTFRAQSGTGKTATFSISILQCLDTQVRETQALVLSPTRELAAQIQKVRSLFFSVVVVVFREAVCFLDRCVYTNTRSQLVQKVHLLALLVWKFEKFLFAGYSGFGWLHERAVSLLYRRYKHRWRHQEVGLRSTCRVWNPWQSVWWACCNFCHVFREILSSDFMKRRVPSCMTERLTKRFTKLFQKQ